MRIDFSPLDEFFERTTWPLTVGCKRCFPEVDMVLCDDVASVRTWIQWHADVPHEGEGMDLLLMPPLQPLEPDFFGPGIGASL